jgi:hypothetical protein
MQTLWLPDAGLRPDLRQVRKVGFMTDRSDLERAIMNACYALDPNQGERPNPVTAYQWLRTTFPTDHPNYVDPSTLTASDYVGNHGE